MNTYIQLKQQEKTLHENKTNIKKINIELISQLDELIQKYPEQFRILPKNLESISFYKMPNRLEVLKEEIEVSSIEEDEKNIIIKLIDSIEERIKENNKEEKIIDEDLIGNEVNIQKRTKYLQEKVKEIDENLKKIRIIDKKISFHQQIIDNANIESSVQEEARKVVVRLENEKRELLTKSDNIISEPNLKEDLELFNRLNQRPIVEQVKEIKKPEIEETNQKETDKEQSTELVPQNVQENKVVEVNSTNSNDVSEMAEESEQQNINPVTPEEPQEVVSVHKAPAELVSKLKKAGKVSLGILVVGAAVAAIIANPIAIAALPAGGLLYEQAKEHLLKK